MKYRCCERLSNAGEEGLPESEGNHLLLFGVHFKTNFLGGVTFLLCARGLAGSSSLHSGGHASLVAQVVCSLGCSFANISCVCCWVDVRKVQVVTLCARLII